MDNKTRLKKLKLFLKQKTKGNSDLCIKTIRYLPQFLQLEITQEEDLKEIAAQLKYLKAGPNEVIIEVGDKADVFFILLDGICDMV